MKDVICKAIDGLIVIGIILAVMSANGCQMVQGLGRDIDQMAGTYTQNE